MNFRTDFTMIIKFNITKEDLKIPIPVPFEVFVCKKMVGLGLVDQVIPREIIGEPPSLKIFPPDCATESNISFTGNVIIFGIKGGLSVRQNLIHVSRLSS